MFKLFIRCVRAPFSLIRNINRDSVRLALGHLKNGDFTALAEGIRIFIRRSAPSTEYKPVIIHGTIDPDSSVALPISEKPLVSIIIPVHNQWEFTHSCLAAIARHSGEITYEVIIADDVSTDRTQRISELVPNARVVRNERNLGFLRNCNRAARAARGEYLLFLNNDTNVQPDWLAPLVNLMEGDATIGIAGSKLVDPDGMLQEAGGIIWTDGSGWNFGRFDDPEKPEYNYLKDVDYISGAAIMVRRELWEKTGGFDERYVPAYYEDTDLAFEARRLGYRVVYQPLSVVVHFEGKSHGTSTSSGIKSYQVTNQQRFVEKWQEVLKKEHYPNGQKVFRARDRSRDRKAILVIDHYVPTRDRDAGSFFLYSLLKALSSLGYRVTFWPANLYRHEPYATELQQLGIEVIYGQRSFDGYMQANGANFDAAILTRNHIAINFIDTVRRHVPKVIYHDPDLEFLREQRRFELEGGSARELEKIKEREFYLFRTCDIVGIHSPVEKEIIEKELPGVRVEVIPLPISGTPPTETPFSARSGLFFVGGSHPPNADALAYFIRDIMPLLRQRMPDITFTVAGEVNRGALAGLDMTGVAVTGYVPDLRPLYAQARVFVAPLRYGAGIKGKILEAMNYGLPVVTTAVGAEGIGLSPGENVIIGDTAETFTQAVLDLYGDETAWTRVCTGGQRHVAEHFSQGALRDRVGAVLDKLLKI